MFKLSDNFMTQYRGKQPNWGFGDLSYFVFKRTYAKLRDDGYQEEWWETCQRVIEDEFSIQKDYCQRVGLPWNAHKAQRTAQDSYERMFEFKWLPPGRGLGNMDYEKIQKIGSAAFLNNCAYRCTGDIKHDFGAPFGWACDALMNGVGVGFSTKGAGTITILSPNKEKEVFVIPDSREGWAESINKLLNSYTGNKPTVEFDYSLLRPAGAPLKTFGGTASGPEPLKAGHVAIRTILDKLINKPITSTAIVDIMNHIGVFVVAGGTRRSSQLALGDLKDTEYLQMKDPETHSEELRSHRWASNNSIIARSGDNLSHLVPQIVKNGEPGIFFIDNARHYGRMKDGYYPDGHDKCEVENVGVNPCSEQILDGQGELCTLTETFPANHESLEDYLKTLKVAYLYAKTVTLLPTHWPESNQIMIRNRRIGLSQSGVQQALKKFGPAKYFSEFCDKAYEYVNHLDKIYSRWLGIPTSIRKTSIKPSGTISLLAGATPGVHCTHSEYYFRTVRTSAHDKLLPYLVKAGYRIEIVNTDKKKFLNAVKQSEQPIDWRDNLPINSLNKKTWAEFQNQAGTVVIYFPVRESNFTKSKDEISLWEQLVLVKELQYYWSDNSVSVTITFKEEEAKDLASAIEFFAPHVKSLSFLPLDNHSYSQAPYQTCSKTEYDEYSKQLKKLDFKTLTGVDGAGEKYCNNDTCEL